jgi:hypothetical protein
VKRRPSGIRTALSAIGSMVRRDSSHGAAPALALQQFLTNRRVRLVRYLQQLFALPNLSTCLPLVAWLGAVSTAQVQTSTYELSCVCDVT